MKLPIAGQSITKADRTFVPAHSLRRALVIVADPGVSTWPFLEGISTPIYRVSEAQEWSCRAITQPVAHHELKGTPSEITAHLSDEKCILLGDWAASWAQVACRVWLTRAEIRNSGRSTMPWDLVLSDTRPRVIQTLLQRIH